MENFIKLFFLISFALLIQHSIASKQSEPENREGVNKCIDHARQYIDEIEFARYGKKGRVYRGFSKSLNREVAIKLIPKKTTNFKIINKNGGFSAADEATIFEKVSDLRQYSPMFTEFLDSFECNSFKFLRAFCPECSRADRGLANDSLKVLNVYIVMSEFVPGDNLRKGMRRFMTSVATRPSIEFLRSSLFQVFHAMMIATEKLKFSHMDLNTRNLIFSGHIDDGTCGRKEDRQFWIVSYGKQEYKIPSWSTCNQKLKMIDFGLSVAVGEGRTLGPTMYAKQSNYLSARVLFDMRYFMTHFLADIPRRYIRSVKSKFPQDYKQLKSLFSLIFNRNILRRLFKKSIMGLTSRVPPEKSTKRGQWERTKYVFWKAAMKHDKNKITWDTLLNHKFFNKYRV